MAWANGEDDALATLQRLYSNPAQSEANRLKAAGLALPFERLKPPTMNVTGVLDFKEYVRSIRLRQLAKDKARWALEDAAKVIDATPIGPRKPLDFDAPPAETVLGGDDPAA